MDAVHSMQCNWVVPLGMVEDVEALRLEPKIETRVRAATSVPSSKTFPRSEGLLHALLFTSTRYLTIAFLKQGILLANIEGTSSR